MKGLLDGEVLTIEIGESPLKEDKWVDPQEFLRVLRGSRARVNLRLRTIGVNGIETCSQRKSGIIKKKPCSETEFWREIPIERIGTDGNWDEAINMIRSLDGKVDAFGIEV